MATNRKSGSRRGNSKPTRVIDLEANETPATDDGVVADSAQTEDVVETVDVENVEASSGDADTSTDKDAAPEADQDREATAPVVNAEKSGSSFGSMLLSAVLGGGIALGGASLIGENSALQNVPVIGGLFAQDGNNTAVEGELDAFREEIAQLKNSVATPDTGLAEKLAALESELNAVREAAASQTSVQADEAVTAAKETGEKVAALEVRVEEINQRIIESAGGDGVDMEAVKAALSGDVAELSERLSGLEAKLDSADDAQTAETLKGVGEEVAAISDRIKTVTTSLEALDGRMGNLETSVSDTILPSMESVEKAAVAAVESQKVARSVSARSLGAVLENGGAFASELASAEALLGNDDTIDALREYAKSGIRSKADLASGFGAVADKIISLEGADRSEMGVLERFMSSAQSLVKVRPAGPVEGDGNVAVVSRIEAALKSGDLSAAIGEYDGLDERAREASSNWRENAGAYLEAEGLINQLIGKLSATDNGEG